MKHLPMMARASGQKFVFELPISKLSDLADNEPITILEAPV